ncbi:MAG: DUF192 domain-containing protein [Bryobacteraceae bacterium]
MSLARVRNLTKGVSLADRAEIADTSAKRRTGLLKHECLPPGSGLWIVPTEGIHTIGMKFPIDVLFLSRDRRVVKIRPNMGKWRMALSLRAHSVLELPAGAAAETGTTVGDRLEVERIQVDG